MSDASDALALLEKQKARAMARGERNTQRAFRFCRDVFSGCGMFVPRVFGLDWLKDIERVCMRIVPSDRACVMLLDSTRGKLVGKVEIGFGSKGKTIASDSQRSKVSSHRIREVDLDVHPAPMEAVAFRQHCVLCESLSAGSEHWNTAANYPSLSDAEDKRKGWICYVHSTYVRNV